MEKLYAEKGEEGVVVVIALMMLVFLTLLGISATSTTQTEMRIAKNENIFRQNLYSAECAAMAGVQALENETDVTALEGLSFDWLHSTLPDSDIRSETNWDSSNGHSNQVLDETTRYLAVYQGIAEGSSLDIGAQSTSLRDFLIYGCSTKNHGEALVEVGYRKRF
ncbi:MAG: pilus assembly PilX N-terminal domain-containing protein [Deltaproteobacteria bacterium]|nr:pilus assembly PilX N-terminal domain-containing protein [Deltaproteobacteria bacterium]